MEKLIAQLRILKEMNLKPNYSALAREYGCDRRTVKKYNDGYTGGDKTRNKKSKLDKYSSIIREKLQYRGIHIKSVYEFLVDKYSFDNIGTYSNFHKYVVKHKFLVNKNNSKTVRYETLPGKQAQVDWKEDMTLISKNGEIFNFNVFSFKLGNSRYVYYEYRIEKTREDVFECLINAFKFIGGVPEEILFDNMASVMDINTGKVNSKFLAFSKDMGFKVKRCKPRTPKTKGKVETCNKFIEWLIPYNHEFEDEKEDRFYKDLEFGTAGLRGVVGIGTNRMNKFTVGKATQGLANYIIEKGGQESGVVIGYDSRHMSKEFSELAALILNANGIKTYRFEELCPTPQVSFAIRHLKCISGIMVTASHNPPKYNGYKVYWDDGAQITSPVDKEITEKVNAITDFSIIKTMPKDEAIKKGLYNEIGSEMDDLYIAELKKNQIHPEAVAKSKDLKIVYTPLHGTGGKLAKRILSEVGFENVYVVPEQEKPDGDFPTVDYPNPEDPKAFKMALELAKKVDADLVLANDPDADRIGVHVKDNKTGEYILFNGNMIGLIVANYLITEKRANGTLINEYKKRKSEENSQNIKFSRYIEHSELTDISLNKRSINKEISLEEQVISNLESERIIKEIWKLPTPQNRRVYMYIVDEFSYTKIAKIENRSIPTVKESIDRGLENLRKKLKKFYK